MTAAIATRNAMIKSFRTALAAYDARGDSWPFFHVGDGGKALVSGQKRPGPPAPCRYQGAQPSRGDAYDKPLGVPGVPGAGEQT